MKNTIQSLLIILMLVVSVQAYAETVGENPFIPVDLDQFIQTERVTDEGKKVIKMGKPILFEAILKQYPDMREMSYVYTAMELARFDPIPEVEYRMFVESEAGVIHPVYVENSLVPEIQKQLREGELATFVGYHLYNYARGPAILVIDFDK